MPYDPYQLYSSPYAGNLGPSSWAGLANNPYGGATATTPGAPSRAYDPTYGGIPQVPSLPQTQGAAIGSNLGNMAGLQGLGTTTNQYQQGQLLGQYQTALPGYSNLVGAASGNIASNLAGQVPQDVRNQLAIGAAERGISTGVGAPNSNAALLRALGLTSLGLQNQGQSQLTEAIHRSPVAQPFDISRFFFSPQEAFQAQQGANIYQAAPQPGLAGRAALNAAQSGLNAGRQSGGMPASSDLVSGIAGRYSTPYGGSGAGGALPTRPPPSLDWSSVFGTGPMGAGGYNPYTDQSTMAPYGNYGGAAGPETEEDAWRSLGVDIYGPNTGYQTGVAGGPGWGTGEFNPEYYYQGVG